MSEATHRVEGLGTAFILPERLVECFKACVDEVERRPKAGRAVHLMFQEYQDRAPVFPRYEGRFAPQHIAACHGALLVYDMTEILHKHLGEFQEAMGKLGVEFVVNSPTSGHGWIRKKEADLSDELMAKIEKKLSEIGDKYL